MTFHNQFTTWFLAQLKPNCARIADRNLTRQGFRTFLPMEEQTVQRKGKFVTEPRPMFPGYIFVAFDVSKGHWRSVNATYGITRLVCFGKDPAPVPPEIMSQLKHRCNEDGTLLPTTQLKPGDQVQLTKGPFANFAAQIEKVTPDQRIWVLMEIMGSQTRMTVAAEQLRLA